MEHPFWGTGSGQKKATETETPYSASGPIENLGWWHPGPWRRQSESGNKPSNLGIMHSLQKRISLVWENRLPKIYTLTYKEGYYFFLENNLIDQQDIVVQNTTLRGNFGVITSPKRLWARLFTSSVLLPKAGRVLQYSFPPSNLWIQLSCMLVLCIWCDFNPHLMALAWFTYPSI